MVWTCRAQHRLDCRSTQAECGCTEKIRQAKEIMGWSAWEWQKEARYGFCWPSQSFWVERMPSRKTCQKAQPSVEENRALKWIWWWWCSNRIRTLVAIATYSFHWLILGKLESAIFAVSLQIFRFFFYRNVSWVVLYDSYEFFPNHWIWIGCHGNIKGNYSKVFSSEAIKGMKLKLNSIHVNDSSLYINCFLLSLPMWFHCCDNLKFP